MRLNQAASHPTMGGKSMERLTKYHEGKTLEKRLYFLDPETREQVDVDHMWSVDDRIHNPSSMGSTPQQSSTAASQSGATDAYGTDDEDEGFIILGRDDDDYFVMVDGVKIPLTDVSDVKMTPEVLNLPRCSPLTIEEDDEDIDPPADEGHGSLPMTSKPPAVNEDEDYEHISISTDEGYELVRPVQVQVPPTIEGMEVATLRPPNPNAQVLQHYIEGVPQDQQTSFYAASIVKFVVDKDNRCRAQTGLKVLPHDDETWHDAYDEEIRRLISESPTPSESTALSIRGGGGEIASNVCFMATESDGSHRISVPMLKYYKDNISTWFDMVAVYGDSKNPECSSILSGAKLVPSKSAYQAADAVDADSRTEDQKEDIRLYKANITLKGIIAMGQSIRDPNSELILHMIKTDGLRDPREFPHGNAKHLMDQMIERFDPATHPVYAAELNELHKGLKFHKRSNPLDLLSKIEKKTLRIHDLIRRGNLQGVSNITDGDQWNIAQTYLDDDYNQVVHDINRRREDNLQAMGLGEIRRELHEHYLRLIQRDQPNNNNYKHDMSLQAQQFTEWFSTLSPQEAKKTRRQLEGEASYHAAGRNSRALTAAFYPKKARRLEACKKCGSLSHPTSKCTRLDGRHKGGYKSRRNNGGRKNGNGSNPKPIRCWNCNEWDHMARDCPKNGQASYAMMAQGEKLAMSEGVAATTYDVEDSFFDHFATSHNVCNMAICDGDILFNPSECFADMEETEASPPAISSSSSEDDVEADDISMTTFTDNLNLLAITAAKRPPADVLAETSNGAGSCGVMDMDIDEYDDADRPIVATSHQPTVQGILKKPTSKELEGTRLTQQQEGTSVSFNENMEMYEFDTTEAPNNPRKWYYEKVDFTKRSKLAYLYKRNAIGMDMPSDASLHSIIRDLKRKHTSGARKAKRYKYRVGSGAVFFGVAPGHMETSINPQETDYDRQATLKAANAAISNCECEANSLDFSLGFQLRQPNPKADVQCTDDHLKGQVTVVLMSHGPICSGRYTSNTWTADSGSTNNITNNMRGMFDVEDIYEPIAGISGGLIASKLGKKSVMIKQVDGTRRFFIISPVKYCAKARTELFSINTELDKEGIEKGSLSSDSNDNIILSYPSGERIVFDRRMRTKDGRLSGVEMIPIEYGSNYCYINSSSNQCTVALKDYHDYLGHTGDEITKLTAKANGVKLHGPPTPCKGCLIGKARQKNVGKAPKDRATKPGERLFIDISSYMTTTSLLGNKHFVLAIDDYSDRARGWWIKQKSDISNFMFGWVNNLKAHGLHLKYIRSDGAGENRKLVQACLHAGLPITHETTAPNTPQQNGRVERRFQTYWARVRACLIASGIENPLRDQLWCLAAKFVVDMDNLCIRPGESMSPFHKFFGKGTKPHVDFSKKFGEMVVVAIRDKIRGKLTDRGKFCRFVGYAKGYAQGTYELLDLSTNQIIRSRDVRPYRTEITKDVTCTEEEKWHDDDDVAHRYIEYGDDPVAEPVSEDLPSAGNAGESQDDNEEDAEQEDEEPRYTRASRELRKLTCSYNPEPERSLPPRSQNESEETPQVTTRSATTADDVTSVPIDVSNSNVETDDATVSPPGPETSSAALMATSSGDDPPKEPVKFEQAWNHPNPKDRAKWREAINKEFNDMKKRGVWEIIRRREMPSDRRCVKSKWVFKIKRDGRYRARLVACGYSQIPGVDFEELYSPVINDMTFKTLIALMMKYGYAGKIVDVETAFLYGELEEEIFMECPPGMQDVTKDNVLLLHQCIYGLVQAARQYYKKIKEILNSIGFLGGDVDPCLFYRKNKKGTCYIALYVDDNLIVGDMSAINDAIRALKDRKLILKIQDDLKDYLSCEILFSNNTTQAWVGQPHLVSSIETEFGEEVKNVRSCLTPGTPGQILIKESIDNFMVSSEKHSRYRTGVGKLLYLVKYSRPDIANCVRELSKCVDGPTETTYKELLRVIKYVLDTPKKGLKMHLTKGSDRRHVVINCYTDSDHAGDPVTRRSISGHVMYLDGVPISWRSKAQSSVSLSSTEAEWIALSEATKEVMFLINLLENIEIYPCYPIYMFVDNAGAVFMSKNAASSQRSKHIDVRYKYVRELIDEGLVKVVYVPTKDNDADIFTKNLASELYQSHADKLTKSRPSPKKGQGK